MNFYIPNMSTLKTIKTKVTKMLGIEYPIIGGTMMNISWPEFAAACSNAGGLGIMGSVMFREPETLREGLQKLKSLTNKPIALESQYSPTNLPAAASFIWKVWCGF